MESGIFDLVFICKECIAFIFLSEEQNEQQETICSSKLFPANAFSEKFSRDVSQDPFPMPGVQDLGFCDVSAAL